LKNIDQWMTSGRQLKTGNTATVAKVCYNGNHFVVKRYNIKNWRHAISRSLRPTRGWNSWHNGNYLRFNEISTPLPVALVEERFGFIKRRAWLVTEYADGIDLLTAADPNTLNSPVTSQLSTMVADVVLQLIQANISHGDMKATNFIVTDNGLELIDLDAMRIHVTRAKTITAIKTDIDRLLRNWDDTKVKLSFSSAIDLVLGDDFTPTP
jgi:tRNA A-37 threonylcarbamoyl transferase component Bud32